jgi:NAD(P)-dependent dehydrogenase (short-subunit alcohol dehydrogenase family)
MTEIGDYYKGRVVVVTGAASGVGLALTETMLSYGAITVVLVDFNDENLERETARLEKAYPGKTLAVHCDVTTESDVQAMIDKAVAFAGRIDLLFNNAGAGFGGAFDRFSNEDWTKAFAVNFYGALYGVRAVLPIMRKQGGGHIVNVISGIAFLPMPEMTMYSATKAALNGLTLALRSELWDENIRVTSATPGTTVTAIWGATKPPSFAQSAQQSAQTILDGVAKNQRVVFGDVFDAETAKTCFHPEAGAKLDEHLIEVARKRRAGETAF